MMKMRLSCFCIMSGAEAFTAVAPAAGGEAALEGREVSPYAQIAKNAVGSELTYKQKISLGMEDIFENKLTQYTNKLAQAAKIRAELSSMLNMALEADDDVMRNLVNAERFRDGNRGVGNDDEAFPIHSMPPHFHLDPPHFQPIQGGQIPVSDLEEGEKKSSAAKGAKAKVAR